MKTAWYAAALGAALFLSGSNVAVNAMGGCHPRRTCAVDLNSLCTGITPGEGRIPACLMSHMANLSTTCSATAENRSPRNHGPPAVRQHHRPRRAFHPTGRHRVHDDRDQDAGEGSVSARSGLWESAADEVAASIVQ